MFTRKELEMLVSWDTGGMMLIGFIMMISGLCCVATLCSR